MDQIAPHPLWVGHAGDGRDFRRVFDAGIRAVVQLAMEEPAVQMPREIVCCRFPLLDGMGNSDDLMMLAINTLATLLKMRMPTLVCCSAGMSRSPVIAAAALSLAHQQSFEKCLQSVAQHHPCDVSPGLWSAVIRLLHSPH